MSHFTKGLHLIQGSRSCVCSHGRTLITSAWGSQTKPVIRLPVKLEKKFRKSKEKLATEAAAKAKRKWKGETEVIVCKQERLNHYKGQTYGRFKPVPLASTGWMKNRSSSCHDHFTINSTQGNPSLTKVDDAEEASTFEHLGLNEELVAALTASGFKSPTSVQELLIPEILRGNNVLCGAETGSGKTVAYLAPVVQQIFDANSASATRPPTNSPQALVLVPGRELAEQVYTVIKSLCRRLGVRADMVVGGRGTKKLLAAGRHSDCDILVATPGVLWKLLCARIFTLEHVNYVVVDEADSLLDDSFNDIICPILRKIKFRAAVPVVDDAVGAQAVFTGATIPKSLHTILDGIVAVESLMHVTGEYLHRVMPHVTQKFIRMHAKDRPEALLVLLKSNTRRAIPTIVFCNNTKGSDFVNMLLEENGIPNVVMNGHMTEQARRGRFTSFQDGRFLTLVCTDVGSRGLDTLKVRHVINFDFPLNMSDYIHRCGRTGRVGTLHGGHVTNFVCFKNNVELVQQIELSVRKSDSLPKVNANIRRRLFYRALARDGSPNAVHPADITAPPSEEEEDEEQAGRE